MSGWEESTLQAAIVQCRLRSGHVTDCPVFDVDFEAQSQCKYIAPEIAAREDCSGPREGLCGNPRANLPRSSYPTSGAAAELYVPAAKPTTLRTAIRVPSMHTHYVTDWVDATVAVTEYVKRAAPTEPASGRRFAS
jgi:hypothetical protein